MHVQCQLAVLMVLLHQKKSLQVMSFLRILCAPSNDGRILIEAQEGSDFKLRYLLLNAIAPFAPIVRQARAVILAGGTMSPCDELITALQRECGSFSIVAFAQKVF